MGSSNATARLIFAAVVAISVSGMALADCAPGKLDVKTPQGVTRLSVEIADTPAERAKGLMFVEDMASSAGMLFVYTSPQHPFFWMKNTLIPLDIIFADASGVVTRVQADAIPEDETPLDGGPGVEYVLEINGGLAKRLGIGPGAVFRHPAIPASVAEWPCTGE